MAPLPMQPSDDPMPLPGPAVPSEMGGGDPFRRAYQEVPVGAAMVGVDQRYLRVNPALCSFTGYSEAELLQMRYADITHPEDLQAGLAAVARLVSGEMDQYEADKRYLRKDGSVIWGHLSLKPVRNARGEVLHFLPLIEDITDRKRAEESLRLEREQAERYLSVVQVILVAFDAEARITLLNRKGYAVLGYEEGELVGQDWFKVCLPPEEYDAVLGVYRRIVSGDIEPLEYYENHIVRKDGGRRLIAWHNSVVRDGTGQIIGILSSGEDITERRRAEASLRDSEEQLRVIFETSEAGIIQVSAQGEIRFANRCMAEMLGVAPQALIGTSYPSHLHASEKQAGEEQMRQLITGEIQSVSVERRYLRGDGTDFWGHLSGRRLENPDGSLRALVGVITDLTELKRMADERFAIEQKIQQAQKMESLGSLAGGVAHDMNNVLGAILGLASAHLDTQPEGSPSRRAFETIIKAAERGGSMVKSLLNLARQSPSELRELDLNAILREEVSLLERTTLAKIHLRMDLAPDLRPIRGDAGALAHAFMNLCVNAVEAMPETGTLTLGTRNLADGWVEVRVEDTGTGMSGEVLEKAMDPFFTTKAIGKGTGLGLALVYSTVKAHQGQVELHSEPGRGTRVELRFPPCAAGSPAAEPEALAPSGPGQNLSVLLVDDDELIQSSIQAVLAALGHTVTPALCGEEALARLEAGFLPDVIILDMNMPGLGGGGTLPRLRALNPAVPILLATGRADQAALDLVATHPHVTLLSKPFSMGDLRRHLEPLGGV